MSEKTLNDVYDLLAEIKADVVGLIALQKIAPHQIAITEGLSDISRRLGLVQAGEFRAGNGQDPGKGFSGIRIGYPPFTYNSEEWNIAGVEDDVLQTGIRASDGKLIAGGGNVVLGQGGIFIYEDAGGDAFLGFYNQALDESVVFNIADDNLQIISRAAGGEMNLFIKLTDLSAPYLKWFEDSIQANRTLLQIQPGVNGARIGLVGNMGVSNDTLIDFRTQGSSGGSTFMRMRETTVTPDNPGASTDAFHLYMKDNKLIIQSRDAGGLHYKYLTLDDTSVTWVHTTTPP